MASPRRALEPLPDDVVTDDAPHAPRRALGSEPTPSPRQRRRRLAVGLVAGVAVIGGLGTALAVHHGTGTSDTLPASVGTPQSRYTEELSRAASVEREEAESEETQDGTAPDPELAPVAPASTATSQPQKPGYTTAGLNVRGQPSPAAELVAVLPVGTQVTRVGDPTGGWQQIAAPAAGYVNAEYLSDTAPAQPSQSPTATATQKKNEASTPSTTPTTTKTGGVSSSYAPCGSNIDSGITPRAVNVKRAICTNYPDVQSFIGRRGDGEHVTGRAVDAMVSGARGREIASWLRANASQLGVTEIIYEQKIWTQQRSSEGWRSMSDRGSRTANHYDHIHILVR